VIFEAPPTADGADASALAQLADAAIMAIEVPRSLRGEVLAGVRRLDRMGAAVLGAVLLPSLGKAAPPRAVPEPPAAEPPAVPEPPAAEPWAAPPPAAEPWGTEPWGTEPGASGRRVSGAHVSGLHETELPDAESRLAEARSAVPPVTPPRATHARSADPLAPKPAAARGSDRYGDPYGGTDPAQDIRPADYLVYPPRAGTGGTRPAPVPDDIADATTGRLSRGGSDRGASAPGTGLDGDSAAGGEPGSAAAAATGQGEGALRRQPRRHAAENGIHPDGAPDTIARG
jgi:translation initiation factor IF-2